MEPGARDGFTLVQGLPLASGWTGKLWALEQGIRAGSTEGLEYFLFTDADISHSPKMLAALVSKAQADNLDLVSVMATLRVNSFWDRSLVPAFVYFFAKLYPFHRVNDPESRTAAAAGGCLLVRREALDKAGGLASISSELIDDCALASLIKKTRNGRNGRIWLGLSKGVESRRTYGSVAEIWRTVSRTAFTQLDYSWLRLAATVLGMTLMYLLPPVAAAVGVTVAIWQQSTGPGAWLGATGLFVWTIMAGTFLPSLKWYQCARVLGFLLPVAGLLYTRMTIDSALRHWCNLGGGWKGRTYPSLGRDSARRM